MQNHDTRTHQNGNGFSNGNGEHRKVFSLAPAEPDLTTLILGARDEVINDPSISHGAARMFVKILDLSVRQASNVRPGVVTISQTKLAETFGVSQRTVWNWKWELLQRRVIWMTSQPMPNAWPIDTYHVTAIHAPQNSGDKTSVEGLWGNGARQRRPEHQGMGAREPGQTRIPGTGVRSNRFPVETNFQDAEKSPILPAIATPPRNELPPCPETDFGGEPKQIATEARNELRATPETDCDGGPKILAGHARNPLRRGAEASCEHKKAKGEGLSPSEGKNPLNVHQGVSAFEKLKRKGGEKTFLNEVTAVMARWSPKKAEKELANYGGWWRNRFRENADRAWRIIAEVGAMITEGRITKDPGKTAMDLWGRFA